MSTIFQGLLMQCSFCHREFKNYRSLNGHLAFCEKGLHRIKTVSSQPKRISKAKIKVDMFASTPCRFCGRLFPSMYARNGHETSGCKLNPNKYSIKSNKGYKHTTEAKEKISKIRIAYLQANPSQVPYLLNHSSKESYPEKYFREILEKENLKFEPQFPVGSYNLDFAFVDQKIDFEVDGDQHHLDPAVVKSDIRRNKYLSNLGWTIIRVKWSDFQKLSLDKKEAFVYDLLNKLR